MLAETWNRITNRRQFDLDTKLPAAEVEQRLANALRFSQDVHGKVRGRRFWMRRRVLYRNPLQTHVLGEIVDQNGDSRLVCTSRPHLFTLWWFGLWFAVLFAMVATDLLTLRAAGATEALSSMSGPLLLLAFGAAIVGVGRSHARNDESLLVEFINKTTGASRT
jgi:hypothetical protein